MSTAKWTTHGVTHSGFLTLVIEALRRSSALADEHPRYARRDERSRGATLALPTRAASTAGRPARALDGPAVTGGLNRIVSARPDPRAVHSRSLLPELPAILDSVAGAMSVDARHEA
jgi:hypothetical protein